MAARRRSRDTRDLPPNLYVRNGYYSYRDPRNGKEYGLGRDKRLAINEAVAANMTLFSPSVNLIDRINDRSQISLADWCDRYIDILTRREVAKSSMTEYRSRINAISEWFGAKSVDGMTTKDIAEFLDSYVTSGRAARAKLMRSTLLDMFREAIAEGIIKDNPVEATRNARVKVKRSRFTTEEFKLILAESEKMQPWVSLSIELAAVTGQRVSDIAKLKWADIYDGCLWIEQKKTGMKLTIPTTTSIGSLNISLSGTLDKCRKHFANCETVIATRTGKKLGVGTISKAFAKARDATGIVWNGEPPPYHEIRSLSARLYDAEMGKKFTQKLLGHKSAQMSERYIDARGAEWVKVE
ncbi:tyrosine-type recombinase/integrase [Leminorella grimontii]|uniref:tyrosine-type recombinase/integrase n=1 Tax=Leminorella grimontii TaxID=82981 RepID=UPI00207F704B|nr:tyrosine-type recombinase/integrase [Leminorella grimontii]GKX60186.1 integrase [Leminorella grimontii]